MITVMTYEQWHEKNLPFAYAKTKKQILQLHKYCAADLLLCFLHMQKAGFSLHIVYNPSTSLI